MTKGLSWTSPSEAMLSPGFDEKGRTRTPILNRWVLSIVIGACLVAWLARWLQDDAYITFRYSQHVLRGWGPVWNQNHAIEGYSNFSWMVALVALGGLGLPLGSASQALGIACLAWSLTSVYRLGQTVLPNATWSALAVFCCATNYSFLMYGTGGLETPLITALTLASLAITVQALEQRRITPGAATSLSVCLGLAVMTRPDAPLMALATGGTCMWIAWRSERRGLVLALLTLPGLLLVLPWLIWKLQFYGDVLPNTYYAKVTNRNALTWLRGLIHVTWLYLSFWWLPILVWIAVRARGRLLQLGPGVRALIAYVVLWSGYVASVGGDIMEFRMLIPIIASVMVLLVWGMERASSRVRDALPLVLVLCLGSLVHARFFPQYVTPEGIGNIPELARHVALDQPASWARMGQTLRRNLGPGQVTIAVSPAGAIPFFSEQRTLDVLGLNDAWVARHGFLRKHCGVCQGHARIATIAYMRVQGVDLLFAHPQVAWSGSEPRLQRDVLERMFFNEALDFENLPQASRLLHIPLDDESVLLAVYMNDNARVEELLANGTWQAEHLDLDAEVGAGLGRSGT